MLTTVIQRWRRMLPVQRSVLLSGVACTSGGLALGLSFGGPRWLATIPFVVLSVVCSWRSLRASREVTATVRAEPPRPAAIAPPAELALGLHLGVDGDGRVAVELDGAGLLSQGPPVIMPPDVSASFAALVLRRQARAGAVVAAHVLEDHRGALSIVERAELDAAIAARRHQPIAPS